MTKINAAIELELEPDDPFENLYMCVNNST